MRRVSATAVAEAIVHAGWESGLLNRLALRPKGGPDRSPGRRIAELHPAACAQTRAKRPPSLTLSSGPADMDNRIEPDVPAEDHGNRIPVQGKSYQGGRTR